MVSKIVAKGSAFDLSEINTAKEIKAEIALLKKSIKEDEDELEERLRRLPQHAIKSAADNLLPSFINKMIANGSWKLLMSGVSLFANPFSRGMSVKKNIIGSAKKLGLMALVKGAYTYFTHKKSEKTAAEEVQKSSPVTSIKNKPRPGLSKKA